MGIDGSPALLERAAARIEADEVLRAASARGRIALAPGDVRTVLAPGAVLARRPRRRDRRISTARRTRSASLSAAGRQLAPDGVLIVDQLGPGALPVDDLPLSLDWERRLGDRRVVRRSRLDRRMAPEGMRVEYSTLTDVVEADGTITRLPAGFRLWYPSSEVTVALAGEANLGVVAAFGSHDLQPLDDRSERCIIVLGRPSRDPGRGE